MEEITVSASSALGGEWQDNSYFYRHFNITLVCIASEKRVLFLCSDFT